MAPAVVCEVWVNRGESKGSLETGCQELGKEGVTEVAWSKYMTKCKLLVCNFIMNYHFSTKLLPQE